MTRTVADAAIVLSALAGTDPRDPATEQSLGKSQPDYTRFLNPRGLRGARIGVARKHFGLRAGADKIIETAIETMKSCGAIIVDPADFSTHGKFEDSEFAVMLYEFKAGLNAYLARLGPRAPVRTLKEIIEFNERNKEKELLYFGQDTFIKAEAKGPLTEKAYLVALEKNRRLSRDEGIDAVMNQHRLDALVAPTTGPAHKIDLLYGDRDTGGSSTPAAVAGYPSITVPAGHVFGLPVGVSFFGRAFSEPTLIKLAFAFEQATKVRQPPKFMPTVG
jgi:amidase